MGLSLRTAGEARQPGTAAAKRPYTPRTGAGTASPVAAERRRAPGRGEPRRGLGARRRRDRTGPQGAGNGQALGLQVMPLVFRYFVCCIMTGASAPSLVQYSWLKPSRCPTSWLISICR